MSNDALSSKMRNEIIDIASSETWIKGVRGGKGSFFRAATTEPTHPSLVPDFLALGDYHSRGKHKMFPFMLIGQPHTERLYKCVDATIYEQYLMRTVDEIVMKTTGGAIQCHHNLISWLLLPADKCFDYHTDANEWHTTTGVENDTYLSTNGVPLPPIEGAFTFTIAITRYVDPEKAVKITWKREAVNQDQHWSLMMSGNNVHFQLLGTQAYGIVHAGERALRSEFKAAFPMLMDNITKQITCDDDLADKLSAKDGNWRLVLSFRQIVSASACSACYLRRFDMRPWLLDKPFLGECADDNITGPLSIFEEGDSNTSNSKGVDKPRPKKRQKKTPSGTETFFWI
jgi:hypothetical protein